MSRPAALRIAKEKYEEFRGNGEFTFCQIHEACIAAARAQAAEGGPDLSETALDGLFAWAVEKADKDIRFFERKEEPSLFPMNRVLVTGKSSRIDIKKAHLDHLDAWLKLSDANLQTQLHANLRDHEMVDRIRPYMGPGKTYAQGVEDYYREHPLDDEETA